MKNRIGLGKWNCKREILTLAKLAEEEKHTYWKFSQSEKGRSVEVHYIEYVEGEITIAKDRDKLLYGSIKMVNDSSSDGANRLLPDQNNK